LKYECHPRTLAWKEKHQSRQIDYVGAMQCDATTNTQPNAPVYVFVICLGACGQLATPGIQFMWVTGK